MKRVLSLLLVLLICFGLVACSNEKKTNDNSTEEISVVSTKDDPQASSYIVDHLSEDDKDPEDSFAIEIENENAIFEYSLQSFVEKFSDFAKDNDKTAAYKDVFLYVANNKNMDLIGAPFFHVNYVPSMTESGEMTEDGAAIIFTWLHKDCELCESHIHHESISLKLIFDLNGIDREGVITRKKKKKTGENELYKLQLQKQYINGAYKSLTLYKYIFNDQYYLGFEAEDDIPNKQQAEEMFYALCRDISGYLNKSE